MNVQAILVVTSTAPRTWHSMPLERAQAPERALREALLGGDEDQFARFVEQRYAGMERIASCAADPREALALVQQSVIDFCAELAPRGTDLSIDAELFGCLLRRIRARTAELGVPDPFEVDEQEIEPSVASDRFRGDEHRWGGGWVDPPKPFAEIDAMGPATVADLQRVLAIALDRLHPALAVVVVLRDMQGLTSSEIARLLSLPEPQARTRLHRARSRVRAELEAHLSHRATQEAPP